MSQIKLDNAPGPPLLEGVFTEPGSLHAPSNGSESFDDHLQRAQTCPERCDSSPAPATTTTMDRPPADAPSANTVQPTGDRSQPARDQRSSDPGKSPGTEPEEPSTDQAAHEDATKNSSSAETETETETDAGQQEQPEASQTTETDAQDPAAETVDDLAVETQPVTTVEHAGQSPADVEQANANSEQPPLDSEQLPVNADQLSGDREQLPGDSEQPAVDSEQPPDKTTPHAAEVLLDKADAEEGDAEKVVSGDSSTEGREEKEDPSLLAGANSQVETVGPQKQLPGEPEVKRPAEPLAPNGPPADHPAEASQETARQHTTRDDDRQVPRSGESGEAPTETAAPTGRNQPGQPAEKSGEAAAQRQPPAAQNPRSEVAQQPQREGEKENPPPAPTVQQPAQQPTRDIAPEEPTRSHLPEETAQKPASQQPVRNETPDQLTGKPASEPSTRKAPSKRTAAVRLSGVRKGLPKTGLPSVSSQQAVSATELQMEIVSNAAKPLAGGTADTQPDTQVQAAPPQISPGQVSPGQTLPTQVSPSNQLPAEAAQQPRQTGEPGQVDRTRFVQRVTRAFRAVGQRNGSVRLRLSPPELGSLRLEISVRNGLMTARVEAETQTARHLLLDNLPALRDRLAQQDIKVEQFNVELMDRSPGGLPDRTAGDAASHDRGGSGSPSPANDEDDGDREDTAATAGLVSRPGEENHLNVVI